MKRFVIKSSCVLLLVLLSFLVKNRSVIRLVCTAFHYDTFNVFHWKDIRFTEAEPNKNFIKTRYILEVPQKYNAFVFGSSRVGYIPPDGLPQSLDGTGLNWYNMTCSEGIPVEHYMTLETFLNNGVHVEMVMLGFDNIPMYVSLDQHKHQLLRRPYQVYEEKKWGFFRPYLKFDTPESIREQIDSYDPAGHAAESRCFYDFGTDPLIADFGLTEHPQMERYEAGFTGWPLREAYKDLEQVARLCREHGIRLVLFTSPLYQSIYRNSVADGYLDFLKEVAGVCEFYNFSGLNNFTQDPQYYFEANHYRPALGLLVEKVIFGTDEEREEVRREAGDDLFGMKVHAGNVDHVLSRLREQLAD